VVVQKNRKGRGFQVCTTNGLFFGEILKATRDSPIRDSKDESNVKQAQDFTPFSTEKK
jgi:hypothetical protein